MKTIKMYPEAQCLQYTVLYTKTIGSYSSASNVLYLLKISIDSMGRPKALRNRDIVPHVSTAAAEKVGSILWLLT